MRKLYLVIFSVQLWFGALFFISANSFGQEICQEYYNNDVIDIPEVEGFCNLSPYCQYEKSFIVPDSYTLSDVNITVNIDHNYNDDLDIYLVSPKGTQVELSTDNGGSANNYNNVTFDESSSNNPSDTGDYILSGTYNPEGNLDDFNGENSKGTWTLIVRDDRLLDGGTIRNTTLRLCYFNYPGGGYKGPGGVGHTNGTSPLVLWTNPDDITEADDDPLVSWTDLSGYGSNLGQSNASYQPIIKKNVVNGYDVVRFETGNRRLIKTAFTNFPTTAISGFYVNKVDDTGANTDGILSYASTTSDNNFLIYRSDDLRMYRDGTKSRTFGLNADNSQWNIIDFAWTSYGGSSRMALNGVNGISVDANQNGVPLTAGGDFALAGEQDGSSSPYSFDSSQAHQGDFSEVIIFNTYISDAERIIVSNYLSAKYSIALEASIDFYDEDTTSDFDHDVAGIGQASDGSTHTDSQGTGMVRINTPSTLTDGDFLFWGRNNKTSYSFQTNTGNYKKRISSNWRVSKTNGVGLGTVTVEIDMTGIDLSGKQDCVPLQLVVDNDADLLTPATTYTLSNTSGNMYQATGVSFSDNDYFTLEYLDEIVWDGVSAFKNGSGTSNEPTTADECLKFLVKSGATVTLIANANVREVEVESGGTLIIDDGVILTITNGINNNGTINVLGEGQVIQNHTGTSLNSGSGSFTITQEGTDNKYDYNYWSSSVNNGGTWKVSDLWFGGSAVNFTTAVDELNKVSIQWLQTFNGPSGLPESYYYWSQIDPTTTDILPGEGFSMKGTGTSGAFTFKGEANNGDYTLPATSGNDYLVGNPYPSDLNADLFIADNITTIDGTLYFWEQFGNANTHIFNDYEGGYATYNALMGTSSTAGTGSVKGVPTGKIAVGQGFFVTTTGGDITFRNSQRDVSSLGVGAAVFYKTTQTKSGTFEKSTVDTRTKIWFSMTDERAFKRIIGLGYDTRATADYDSGYDAKLANFYPDNFYWTLNDDQLMVQGLPHFSKSDVIDLGVEVVNSGTYTFAIDKSENLRDGTLLYLKDKETNTYYNLLDENPVALELVAGTNYTRRYAITFAKQVDALRVDTLELSEVTLSYHKANQQLRINNYPNLSAISSFKIYSLTGQTILDLPKIESYTVQLPKIPNGIYLVEIKDVVNGNVVKKFVKN